MECRNCCGRWTSLLGLLIAALLPASAHGADPAATLIRERADRLTIENGGDSNESTASMRRIVDESLENESSPLITSGCDGAGGIKYDDGGFENALQPTTITQYANMVTKIDLGSGTKKLEKICICWVTLPVIGDTVVAFNARVWAADGPNGEPGTLLGETAPVVASSIPSFSPGSNNGKFYTYDVSHLDIKRSGAIYVGPGWFPDLSDVYVCTDESPTTPLHPGYLNTTFSLTAPPRTLIVDDEFRALGIRAQATETAVPTCVPSATSLCINNDRFRVEVSWKDFQGQVGTGKAVALPGYDDSGLFYFFTANNLELLIKVLDGCALNSNYWVFFAATTNVEFDVTVTDTVRGGSKVYSNILGQAANAVTDTSAFATCP